MFFSVSDFQLSCDILHSAYFTNILDSSTAVDDTYLICYQLMAFWCFHCTQHWWKKIYPHWQVSIRF